MKKQLRGGHLTSRGGEGSNCSFDFLCLGAYESFAFFKNIEFLKDETFDFLILGDDSKKI